MDDMTAGVTPGGVHPCTGTDARRLKLRSGRDRSNESPASILSELNGQFAFRDVTANHLEGETAVTSNFFHEPAANGRKGSRRKPTSIRGLPSGAWREGTA